MEDSATAQNGMERKEKHHKVNISYFYLYCKLFGRTQHFVERPLEKASNRVKSDSFVYKHNCLLDLKTKTIYNILY